MNKKIETYARALFYAHVQGWDKAALEHGGRPTAYTSNEAWASITPETRALWIAQATEMVESTDAPTMTPIPNYGEHMPLAEFKDLCACEAVTENDGSGNYATATEMSDIEVSCSAIADGVEPALQDEKWTHVVWFNK